MSENTSEGRKYLLPAIVLAPALLALGQAAWMYYLDYSSLGLGFPIDDAYIFKRYAENIASGLGFAFNPGETSFGCTSLLWPLLCAFFTRIFFFLDYVTVVFWLGSVLYAAACAIVTALMYEIRQKAWPALLAGVLAAASAPTMLMHGVSGMETSASIALLAAFAWLALSAKPRPITAGLIAGLFTLNRPEGVYFALAIVLAGTLIRLVRGRETPLATAWKFLAAWAALSLPAAIVVHHYGGSYLPGTYLGKIMSTSPGALERGMLERSIWAVLSLGDGWKRLLAPLGVLAPVLGVGVIFEAVKTAWLLKSGRGDVWPLQGMLLLFGLLLLPGAYGYFFPVGPAFGGYYNRYIAPVFVLWIIISITGWCGFYDYLAGRVGILSEHAGVVMAALCIAGMVGQLWLWSIQLREAGMVYRSEVTLNTGLRMEAARWIADPAHVPLDAGVMVGYTGLGVVGGECGRYVLDLGALINPDIIEYYRNAGMDPEKRWEGVVEYMHDRGLGFFVTFAFPEKYADRIVDPAATPGFHEAARLGSPGESASPFEQIRIYRVNWREWESAANNGKAAGDQSPVDQGGGGS